jgi:hypothetical protein
MGGRGSRQVAQAKQLGVTLIVVGVGTASGGNVPDIDAAGPSQRRWKYDAAASPSGRRSRPLACATWPSWAATPTATSSWAPGPASVDAVVVALDALTRGALGQAIERVMDEWYAAFCSWASCSW